jgi:hypothetical protein
MVSKNRWVVTLFSLLCVACGSGTTDSKAKAPPTGASTLSAAPVYAMPEATAPAAAPGSKVATTTIELNGLKLQLRTRKAEHGPSEAAAAHVQFNKKERFDSEGYPIDEQGNRISTD